MVTQLSASSPAVPIPILNIKSVSTDDCLEELRMGPEILTPTGMKEIKMLELFTNGHPFIPREYQDQVCPESSKDVIDKVKKDRSKKAA